MNMGKLFYDAMPPLSVPYRFFITAATFAILVGALLLFIHPQELSSRWSTLTIALTHGVTLGFMLMVMIGSMFQVLPVAAGVNLPNPRKLSAWVHVCLTTGVIALVSGFIITNHLLLSLGAIALFMALTGFVGALFKRLPQLPKTPTGTSLKLAAVSLAVTIVFGLSFVLAWIKPELFPTFRLWTDVHLMWGIVGWTLLLIMGVSFLVIPMFYVTPDYPKWLAQWLPSAIFVQLILSTFVQSNLLQVVLALSVSLYPIYTLRIIEQRKRRTKDVTLLFWQTAMLSLLVALLMFVFSSLFPLPLAQAQLHLLMSTVVLVGFILTLITGMLYKIVPFLVWLHLQQTWIKQPGVKMPLSNMQDVIDAKSAKNQYRLFMLTCVVIYLVTAGIQDAWVIKFAGVMLITTYGYLLFHLLQAYRLSIQLSSRMAQELAALKQ